MLFLSSILSVLSLILTLSIYGDCFSLEPGTKSYSTVIYDKNLPNPFPRGTWTAAGDGVNTTYLFGGLRDTFNKSDGSHTTNEFFNDLWRFTVSFDINLVESPSGQFEGSWELVQPNDNVVPSPRTFYEMEMLLLDTDQHLLLYGGGTFANQGFPFFPASDYLWDYDIAANMWINLTDGTGPGPRMSPSSASSGSVLYIFGGVKPPFTLFNDLWQYDINDRQWTLLQPVGSAKPAPRIGALSTYMISNHAGPFFLVYGGGTASLVDSWEFRFNVGRWVNTTDPNIASSGLNKVLSRVSTNGATDISRKKFLIYGGQSEPPTQTGCGSPAPLEPHNGTLVYHADSHSFTFFENRNPNLPYPLKHIAADQLGNYTFIFGGYSFFCGNGSSIGQVFNIDVPYTQNG